MATIESICTEYLADDDDVREDDFLPSEMS